MSVRTLLWTALPNGLNTSGDRLQLSVLLSPRLVTNNGSDGRLAEFPDLLDWPKTASGLAFKVEFQGGPTVSAPLPATAVSALDSEAWAALFNAETFVRSYHFDDKSNLNVLSFPTKKVLSFIRQQYQTVAVSSPSDKPSLSDLGFDPRSYGQSPLGQIAVASLSSRQQEVLDRELRRALDEHHAVPPEVGNAALDFYQVLLMHQPLSKEIRDERNHRVPPGDLPRPDFDFHQAVAAMGQYPKLMRALGLAFDLELPLTGVPASSNVRVTPTLAPPPPPMTPWTAYLFDRATRRFVAAPDGTSDVSNGMLLLSAPDQYDVVEVDIDGAANKLVNFAASLTALAFGGRTSIDTPDAHGFPALRSAGFSAARVGRALRLVKTFQNAGQNNTAIATNPTNSSVVLHAEDVTRGYRIDVWNSSSGLWHSLCRRRGTYLFEDGAVTRMFEDEGFVTVATTQSVDGTSTDLRLPESLFRWRGWSLSVPRPGNTVGPDSKPATPVNPAVTAFKLETSFTVPKGTLPRLRFGAQYQFRARAVDLVGNSLPPDAIVDDMYNLPPAPIAYLRYEPVSAPVIVPRATFGSASPGESAERLVIRSNFDTHIGAVSERHVAPPKASVEMAEVHGMLDTPAGPPDPAVYSLLISKDGSFYHDADHPDQLVPHPEAQLALPYLPDPFAPGAAFRTLPGTAPNSVWKTPFSGNWPDRLPFRLRLDEGDGPPQFVASATERVLTVHLPKAEVVEVDISCFLQDDAMLETMKIWSWIAEAAPATLADLRQLALDGGHWMITPPRTITLVHAVQQPLIEPQFQTLKALKSLGQTFATLVDEFPIDGRSTIKLDIEARWKETVDDGSETAQPVVTDAAARACEQPLTVGRRVAVLHGRHEFHDTKHRTVEYRARATTRFREYFPNAVAADIDNISRVSQAVTLSVLNSARPAAPKPLYVLPTFRWQPQNEGSWTFSRRQGGGLRVYLDRPWYSSGEGELLGVVLWGCSPPPHATFEAFEVPDFLKGLVTQWGKDPLWDAPALPTQAVPGHEHFRNAVAFGEGLSLDELSNRPFVPVSVAAHAVSFDTERQLWYADIEIDSGDAYYPFIRLALARYQSESVADAHLSRIVLAEFAQLMPHRSASITLDPIDLTRLELAISGLTYGGPGQVSMQVTLQTQALGSSGDRAWVPLATMSLGAVHFSGPDTLWTGPIRLPAPRGSRPFRLLIEEFEIYPTDVSGPRQTRLVYADYLNL